MALPTDGLISKYKHQPLGGADSTFLRLLSILCNFTYTMLWEERDMLADAAEFSSAGIS